MNTIFTNFVSRRGCIVLWAHIFSWSIQSGIFANIFHTEIQKTPPFHKNLKIVVSTNRSQLIANRDGVILQLAHRMSSLSDGVVESVLIADLPIHVDDFVRECGEFVGEASFVRSFDLENEKWWFQGILGKKKTFFALKKFFSKF